MNYDKLTKEQLIGIHKDALEYVKKQEQEIERLKEEYMILQNASDEVEEELQQRINEAIEYIEEHRNIFERDGFSIHLLVDDFDDQEIMDILKGEENEN